MKIGLSLENMRITIMKSILILISFSISLISYSQISVNTTLTPQQIVENILVGNGISVTNVTYSGSNLSIGSFTNGNTTNIGMDEGIILSTGKVVDIAGPNSAPNTQTNTLGPSDPQLASLIPGYSIYDAAVLEFDFVPMSDTIKFQYVFASEEYPEWVGSSYNDVFGFFVTGADPSGGTYNNKNLAIVPGTANTVVTVNTVNNGTNNTGPCNHCTYYTDNTNGLTIEFDGFTVIMTTWLIVTPCTNYHIKLAIGDGGDHSYDSGVFLKKNSFSSDVLKVNTEYSNTNVAIEGCSNGLVKFTLNNPSTFARWINYSIGGTAIEGTDYQNIPDSIFMPLGSDSVGFYINPIIDGITEGIENIELIVETSSCSIDTVIIPIHDYDSVNVNITGNSHFCIGGISTLTATVTDGLSPYSYTWSTTDTTSTTSNSPNINTQYWVQITDQCGIIVSDTIDILVHQQPNVVISAINSSLCSGDTTTLNATGANTYAWSPGATLSANTGTNTIATPINTTTYQVIGTDINGCKDTTTTVINTLSLPPIQASSVSSQICIGQNTNLNASGAISYQWAPASSLNASNVANVIASPIATTTYTVIGTGANSCTDSTTTIITVNPLPNVQINPASPSICLNENVVLTASGANTYSWTPSTNLSSTNTAITTATPNNTISYIVQGINTTTTCVNTDTVLVTVNSLPTITTNPVNANICEDSALTINSFGAATYSWSPGASLNTTTGNSVIATPNSNITYTVIGTDANSCKDTAYVNVVVSPIPVITPAATTICQGANASITATATLAGTAFLWSTGAATPTINVSPAATTTYYVTATDGSGCIGIDSTIVTVNPLPTITITPANSSICINDSTSITAAGASSYTWLPNTNITSSTIANPIIFPSNTTIYTVTGTDANGCVNNATTTITVNPLPNVSVTPNNDSICIGTSTVLTASNANTYSWSPTNGLTPNTGAIVTANPTTPTTYIITGTDANGCINTDTAFVFVSPVINISANPPMICIGDSTSLNASTNVPATYLWSTGQTTQPFWVKPDTSTTYSVTVTGTNGCVNEDSIEVVVYPLPPVVVSPDSSSLCNGESATLTASGALTYSWQTNSALNTLTGAVVNASPIVSDTFMVIGTDNFGCKDTAYAEITVLNNITVSLIPTNPTLCEYDSVKLHASGAPSYIWSPANILSLATGDSVWVSPNSSGNIPIKVIGTAANGCQDSAIANLQVNAKPNIIINPDTSHICTGKSQVLTANGANTYVWSPAAGLSSTTISNPTASPANTQTYQIIGTTSGCSDTTTAYVGVHPYPTVTVVPNNALICPNTTQTLTAAGATTYTWNPAQGLNSTTGAIVNASPDSSQLYTVIGSTAYGCTDTATSILDVTPIPVISGIDTICEGQSTTLTVVSNKPLTTFVWNTGATTTSILVNPIISTTYTVTATHTPTACQKDTSFIVKVNGIPNLAVTPLDTTICHGATINITGSGANTYLWQPNNTLSDSTTAIVTATPTASTIYSLIGETTMGCKDTVYTTINLFTAINVNVVPQNTYSCGGGSQALTASGATTYSWAPPTGLNTTTGAIVVAGPTSNSIYTVTGVDTNNCTDTAKARVRIYGPPIINPIKPSICKGDSVQLTANTQNPPNTYIWNTGATTSSIWVSPTASSIYSVTVNYPGGCTKNSSDSVLVYNDSIVIASTPTPFICAGDTTILTAYNNASYSWSGINLLSSTGDSVSANPINQAQYIVIGTSAAHSCKTYDTLIIQIFNPANIVIASSQNPICKRDTAQLNASGGQSYIWTTNYRIDTTIGSTVNISPHSNYTYQVIGTDTNGCKDTTDILINVNSGPTVVIAPDSPMVCQGDTMQLYATGAVSYSWYPQFQMTGANNDTINIFPMANITYHAVGTDALGCSHDTFIYVNVRRQPNIGVTPLFDSICFGDSIAIQAFGSSTYSWSPHNTLSDSIGANVNASPSVITTYTVIGTSTDGCTRSISSTIKVNPYPTVSILPNSSTICRNDSVQLTVNGANTYQWSPMSNINLSNNNDTAIVFPQNTTTYQVVGTNLFGCKDSTTSIVNINPLPNISINPANPIFCHGDSALLTASGAVNYLWLPNTALSSTNTPSVWSSSLLSISYIAEGTDANNCKNTDTVNLIVHPDIIPTATPSADTICYGLSTTLTVGGGASYLWTPAIGLSQTNTPIVTASPLSNQSYNVKVYDIFSCVDSIDVDITVLTLPNVQLNPANTSICIYDTSLLVATGAASYQWNPNTSINITAIDSALVNPVSTTTYWVQGTDTNGCINYDTSIVNINPLPNISINPANPIICHGDSALLTANGGVSYSWLPNTALSSTNTPSVWSSSLLSISYIVEGTDANNCKNTDTVNLIVHPDIIPTATPYADTICYGLSTTLTVGGGASYLWTPAIGLSQTNTPIVIASPLSNQSYNVKVYDIYSCVDSIDVDITVLTLPNVQLNPANTSICIYDTSLLVATGAASYQWNPNTSINITAIDSAYVNPVSTTTYWVQGTDTNGCINYDTSIVNINPLPNIILSAQDTTICIYDSTTLSAIGGSQYVWSPNISLSNTLGPNTITSTQTNQWYYVLGTDNNNCQNIDSLEIIVRPRPQLSITATDSIICSGYYLGLTGHSNMNPTAMIWSTGTIGTTTTDHPTTNTTYQLRGINTYGCDDSVTYDIQVNPFPVLSLNPLDTIICLGDSTDIISTCTLQNLSYLWNTGDTTCDINVKPTAVSTYTLVVSDSIGCSDTLSALIKIQAIPYVNIQANSNHICIGDTLTLTANHILPVTGYSWNIGSPLQINQHTPSINTTYTITVIDSVGCTALDTLLIRVNQKPTVQTSANPNTICIGDTSLLSATSTFSLLNYQWSNTQTTQNINVNPTTTSIYSVTATDSVGCSGSSQISVIVNPLPIVQINPSPARICWGDSVLLDLTSNIGLTQYQWNNSSTQSTIWVGPHSNTIYYVTVTDINGCINDTQELVNVYSNPIVNVTPPSDTICTDDSIQLTLIHNHIAFSILWNTGDTIFNPFVSPMVTKNFSAIFTDTNGCMGYDTSLISVTVRPTCNITTTTPICSFDSTELKYQGSATSAAITNWDFDNGTVLSGTGLNTHYLQWNNAGVYTITLDVTENNCTSYPDTSYVTVFKSPEIDFSTIDSSVCDSIAVDFTSVPGGMLSYHWTFGDPLAMGSDTANIQNPTYTFNAPGNYGISLAVVSQDGCPGYKYKNSMLQIRPNPVADFIANPSISFSNNPNISFIDRSVGATIWEWDFDDPISGIYNFSNNQYPNHIYQQNGTYFVQQIAISQYGCTDTIQKIVIMESGPTFYVPNAFTPNGDGKNDLFVPKGTDFIIDSYQIHIYERWGSKVFESYNYNHQWDGKHYLSGDELSPAVFNYIIYYTTIHDVKKTHHGSIILIR